MKQEISDTEFNMLLEILKIIIPAIIGYYSHVFKNKFDKKYKIKATALILKNDINKTLALSKDLLTLTLDKDFFNVCNDKFTSLDDWQKSFEIIISKLNKKERNQFISYYGKVSEITEAQNRHKKIMDEFNKGNNRLNHGHVMTHIPGRTEIIREFLDLNKELTNIDVDDLLSTLDKL